MKSFIKYRSVDIYFILSFVLDLKNFYVDLVKHATSSTLGWSQGKPADRKGKPPFLDIKNRSAVMTPEGPEARETEYFSTSLHKKLFETPAVRLIYREQQGSEAVANSFDVALEAIVRIFNNGAGCITYRVGARDNVSLLEIHQILSLSQRSYDESRGMARLQINGRNVRLYDLFVSMLQSIETEFNDSADRENNAATERGDGRLVEVQDWRIMDPQNTELASQNPYVLTVLEIDPDRDGKLFWQKHDVDYKANPADLLPHLELAAVLLRIVYPHSFFGDLKSNLGNVRIPYELRNARGTLRNYAWDRTMMMCPSRLSTLFGCLDKSTDPARLVKHSLLDTVEILRTRWHMSVLLNALLDQDMEMIRSTPSSDNTDALRAIIERRRQFAYFLNDPLQYNFEGSSVARVIEIAQQGLWLEPLREMTFKKLQILDQLYKDQMELIRIDQFRAHFGNWEHSARQAGEALEKWVPPPE